VRAICNYLPCSLLNFFSLDCRNVQSPNVPAARRYTDQDNGLVQPWEGRGFLYSPFGSGVERWFSKLYQKRSAGRITDAIVLWKSVTGTAVWKTLKAISCQVCFPSARIRFVGPAGDDGPGSTFSSALFYVGERPDRFERAFGGIGGGMECSWKMRIEQSVWDVYENWNGHFPKNIPMLFQVWELFGNDRKFMSEHNASITFAKMLTI